MYALPVAGCRITGATRRQVQRSLRQPAVKGTFLFSFIMQLWIYRASFFYRSSQLESQEDSFYNATKSVSTMCGDWNPVDLRRDFFLESPFFPCPVAKCPLGEKHPHRK